MNKPAEQADARSDAELLRAYLDPAAGDDGVAFNTIYCRYRDEVRQCLERDGLSAEEAENRVGSVFIRALDREPDDVPASLRELLLGVAHQVARDQHWAPF
jgi:hypothetical protein